MKSITEYINVLVVKEVLFGSSKKFKNDSEFFVRTLKDTQDVGFDLETTIQYFRSEIEREMQGGHVVIVLFRWSGEAIDYLRNEIVKSLSTVKEEV